MMDGDDVLWYHFSFGIVSTRSKFYLELVTFHHGAIYFRFASQRLAGCYYRSTKPIILYERRRCVVCIYTVPVCIIINTNESIGLDWIGLIRVHQRMEYMEHVLYRIHLLISWTCQQF